MSLARPVKIVAGIRAWSSRHRKVQTLLSFARTEAGGAIDIAKAAECNHTPELRAHLLRHAADEARHAAMFRQRAREVQGDGAEAQPPPIGSDLLPTTAAAERGSLSLTDHGFLPSDSYATLGELRYVSMLYLAEREAKSDFHLHRRLNERRDPATADVFRQILRDEEYHIAYTRAQLAAWTRAGRGREVRGALRHMRWLRFKGAWTLFGAGVGRVMGTLLLSALYVTAFAPFGLIARSRVVRRGWQSARPCGNGLRALRLVS